MSKIALPKITVSLDFYGEDWKDCYIKLNRPSASKLVELEEKMEKNGQSREVLEEMKTFVKDHFVEGKVWVYDEENDEVKMGDVEEDHFEEGFDANFFFIVMKTLFQGNRDAQ